MTEKKTLPLVTVLLWVVGLAVAADIVIIVSHHQTILAIPNAQTPVATVAVIAATPMPPPPAPTPTAPVINCEPPPEIHPSDLILAAPVTNDASYAPLQ